MSLKGSCHCGKISYSLNAEITEAMQCNCSICRRKGYLLGFVTPDVFDLKASPEDIGAYTFASKNIQHKFCKTCGCAPFGEGTGPDGTRMIAINMRCADDLDLSQLKINDFDGAAL